MSNFTLSPPYLLTIYENPTKYRSIEVNTDKELEKLRATLEKRKAFYTLSCTSIEAKQKNNSPLRISFKAKKPK